MSATFSLPGQFGGEDTTPEAPRRSRSGNTRHHVHAQFVPIVRSGAGGMLTDLGPHKFRWIELRGCGRERVYPNPRMVLQETAHFDAIVNGMLIPHQDDGPVNNTEQVYQKENDLLATNRFWVRVQMQSDSTLARCHTQCPDQVQTLVVLNARANGGGLPPRRPGALERRHQGKACFIDENQCGPKLLPLFLSAARGIASSAQRLRHSGGKDGAEASDSSSRDGASSAIRRWAGSAPERDPRSHA